MKKVDVLLATYNGENYLKEQLDSILSQTYTDIRLVVSDDASTDTTYKILEEYAKKDNRIIVFKKEQNEGLISNFEFLLKQVKSEYFMFADQDDIWKKDKIEKSIKKLEKENADLVYSDLEVVNENLEVIYPSYWKLKGIEQKIKKYNNFEALYLNNFVTGCTILAKSKYIKEILPLPKTSKYVLHDYWAALIISEKGKIAYIEEPTIQYRQHKNNKVGSGKKSNQIDSFKELRNLFIQVKIEHFQVFLENRERLQEKKICENTKKALEYFEYLKKVKIISLKGWYLFLKLYHFENFSYSIQNFIILNIPILRKNCFYAKKRN